MTSLTYPLFPGNTPNMAHPVLTRSPLVSLHRVDMFLGRSTLGMEGRAIRSPLQVLLQKDGILYMKAPMPFPSNLRTTIPCMPILDFWNPSPYLPETGSHQLTPCGYTWIRTYMYQLLLGYTYPQTLQVPSSPKCQCQPVRGLCCEFPSSFYSSPPLPVHTLRGVLTRHTAYIQRKKCIINPKP